MIESLILAMKHRIKNPKILGFFHLVVRHNFAVRTKKNGKIENYYYNARAIPDVVNCTCTEP